MRNRRRQEARWNVIQAAACDQWSVGSAGDAMAACETILMQFGIEATRWTVEAAMMAAAERVASYYERIKEPWAKEYHNFNMSYSVGERPETVPEAVWRRLHQTPIALPEYLWDGINTDSGPIVFREAQFSLEEYQILPFHVARALFAERNMCREAGKLEQLADAMMAHLLAANAEGVSTFQRAALMESVERLKEAVVEEMGEMANTSTSSMPTAARPSRPGLKRRERVMERKTITENTKENILNTPRLAPAPARGPPASLRRTRRRRC